MKHWMLQPEARPQLLTHAVHAGCLAEHAHQSPIKVQPISHHTQTSHHWIQIRTPVSEESCTICPRATGRAHGCERHADATASAKDKPTPPPPTTCV